MRGYLLFFGILLSLPLRAATPLTPEKLASTIEERLFRTEQFEFIKKEAERLGIRVWLFGGSAAAPAHYIKKDLEREAGNTNLQKERFDYDFTNIYRSNQDADIVIDGPASAAAELERILAAKYPHLQGDKQLWEIRLLREKRGDKLPLLNDPDFLGQHTDSHSVGMIELTHPPKGELRVRDLRDWQSKAPNFLKDVVDGRLHFYFSPTHAATTRAAHGLNPPIFSVIRYFTKAFQYDLEMRPEDLEKIRQIIKSTDIKKDLANPGAFRWLEKNAPKLYQFAQDIEFAEKTLAEVSLLPVLQTSGAEDVQLLFHKKALPSFAVGSGKGRTAAELGISKVAHDTRSHEAFEYISRSYSGRPNVFESRHGKAGEAAWNGDGFYTKMGDHGAWENGYTLQFTADPHAREGTDFTYKRELDDVIWHNKNAFRLDPISSLSPVQFFQMLGNGAWDHTKDRGVTEKLFHSVKSLIHAISPEEEKEILRLAQENTDHLRTGKFNEELFRRWLMLPQSQKYPELKERTLKILKEQIRASAENTDRYVKHLVIFDHGLTEKEKNSLLEAAVGHKDSAKIFSWVIQQPASTQGKQHQAIFELNEKRNLRYAWINDEETFATILKQVVADPLQPGYDQKISQLRGIRDLHQWSGEMVLNNQLPPLPYGGEKNYLLAAMARATATKQESSIAMAASLAAEARHTGHVFYDPDFLKEAKSFVLVNLKEPGIWNQGRNPLSSLLSALGGTTLYDDPALRPYIRASLSAEKHGMHLRALDALEKQDDWAYLLATMDQLDGGPFGSEELLDHYVRRYPDFVNQRIAPMRGGRDATEEWILRSHGFNADKHALLKTFLKKRKNHGSIIYDYILHNEVMDHDPDWAIALLKKDNPPPEVLHLLARELRQDTIRPATAAFLDTKKELLVNFYLKQLDIEDPEIQRNAFFVIDQLATDEQLNSFIKKNGVKAQYLPFFRRIAKSNPKIQKFLAAPQIQHRIPVKEVQSYLDGHFQTDLLTHRRDWTLANLVNPQNLALNEQARKRYDSALTHWKTKKSTGRAMVPTSCELKFGQMDP